MSEPELHQFTDEQIRAEFSARENARYDFNRAATLLREAAVSQHWPGKKMTEYQALAALQFLSDALEIPKSKLGESILSFVSAKKDSQMGSDG